MDPMPERDLGDQHGHLTVLELARLTEIARSDEVGDIADPS